MATHLTSAARVDPGISCSHATGSWTLQARPAAESKNSTLLSSPNASYSASVIRMASQPANSSAETGVHRRVFDGRSARTVRSASAGATPRMAKRPTFDVPIAAGPSGSSAASLIRRRYSSRARKSASLTAAFAAEKTASSDAHAKAA